MGILLRWNQSHVGVQKPPQDAVAMHINVHVEGVTHIIIGGCHHIIDSLILGMMSIDHHTSIILDRIEVDPRRLGGHYLQNRDHGR